PHDHARRRIGADGHRHGARRGSRNGRRDRGRLVAAARDDARRGNGRAAEHHRPVGHRPLRGERGSRGRDRSRGPECERHLRRRHRRDARRGRARNGDRNGLRRRTAAAQARRAGIGDVRGELVGVVGPELRPASARRGDRHRRPELPPRLTRAPATRQVPLVSIQRRRRAGSPRNPRVEWSGRRPAIVAPVSVALRRTPLYERHVAAGARMVPFAGWEMPGQYTGVIPEHLAVRADAGAFDVSHMGQLHVEGPMASEFLQAMLSNDLDRLSDGEAQYTLLTNERGGIVDDLIVYRMSHGHYLLVVNAGNREAAYGWLEEREARGTEVRDASDEYALVALQGARSLERLALHGPPAFTHAMGEVDGVEVMVCRTGYTGEKGVELMCAEDDAV